MLTMPAGASPIGSIVGIDPGSDTLGVGILYVDLRTWQIVSSEAFTLNGTRNGRGSFVTEVHGDRHGRIDSHREELTRVFRLVNPFSLACEAPFISRRRPQAFGALTEVVCAVRAAAMAYDAWRPLEMIDPPTVKRAVGVSGKTGGPEGKKLMLQAVLAMQQVFCYNGPVEMQKLDEHSIDALAVAYCHYIQLLEKLCLKESKPTPRESDLLSYSPSSGISATRTIRAKRRPRRFKKK